MLVMFGNINVRDEPRHAMLRAFMNRDASNIWRSCSHNITKINIQFLNNKLSIVT